MQQPSAPQPPTPDAPRPPFQSGLPPAVATAPPAGPLGTPSYAAVTFLLCAVYFALSFSFVNFAIRIYDALQPASGAQLVGPLLNVAVLLFGLLLIARIRVPQLRPSSAIGLVRRPSAGREAGLGAAVGWATGVAIVLPGVLTLRMHSNLLLNGFHLGAATASTLLLMLFVFGRQLVFCGLPFRSLTRATSPLFASVAFAGVAGLLTLYTAQGGAAEALLAAIAQLAFCMAAARTRAIWLGGALQFAWGFTITLLFGLPSFLWPPATGIVSSGMAGPRWLTGSFLGPEAALWAGIVMLAVLVAVWRLTRDYAWHYTFDPIVGAGYAMDVPPPAEHARMEQAVPLVQIGGVGTVVHDAPAVPIAPTERI